jgi:hypothetical protein
MGAPLSISGGDKCGTGRVGLPPQVTKELTDANPGKRKEFLLATTRNTALALVRERVLVARGAAKVANDLEALSPGDTLDRALRADAAADRGLNRAIDRLDRLQRRRKGEPVLPPVSVRLTQ